LRSGPARRWRSARREWRLDGDHRAPRCARQPGLAGANPAESAAADQRGEARAQLIGTAPDVGAFELNQTTAVYNEITDIDRGEFLSGTGAANLMRGLGGNDDVLVGKASLDQMTGGDADRFLFRHVSDAPVAGPNYDQILGFRRGEHDQIDLRPIDANWALSGNQTFQFIGDEAFAKVGQLRSAATADDAFLVSGNTDRDLDAEFAFVVHTGSEQLNAADFLL
jgi:hypothetical protein